MSLDALGLSLVLRTSALLVLAAALATLLRRQSAALRHLIWTTGLAATLALPLLSLTLPALPLLPAALPSAMTVTAGPRGATASGSPFAAPADRPRAAQPASEVVAQVRSAGSDGALPSRPAVAQAAAAPRSTATSLWLVYGIGVLLLLGWVGLGELAIRRFGGRSAPLASGEWRELVDQLRAEGSVPSRVRLRVSDDASVPLTYGIFRPVVILPASGRQWPLSHQRDVLAHELAHVRRRDCLTHLLGRIACALHWYHPLAWLALSRIRLEREHACDDAVLRGGSLASGYADALLVTARTMRGRPALAGAGLAFARGSSLSERLRAVLDHGRRRGSPRPPALLALAALGLVATVAVATAAPRDASAADRPSSSTAGGRSAEGPWPRQPIERDGQALASVRTPAAVPATEPTDAERANAVHARDDQWPIQTEQTRRAICPRDSEGRERTVRLSGSMSITGQGSASDGKDRYVAWTGADCSVVIQSRGKVTFNESETDVATLDDGALFRITHEIGRTERTYRVSGRGSRLEREYRVDGRAAEMDRAFETWRGTLVLEFIRRSGYDAEGRVRRILDRNGVGGVLAEVRQIESDHVASRYLGHLIAVGRLDPRSATDVLEEAGSGIESDYELARVLVALPTRLLEDESVSRAFVSAARTIESDYELRKALDALLASGRPSPEVTGRLLELATTIESDFELAELLVGLAARGAVTGDFDAAYFAAVATIESDFEAHRVLSALLKSGPRSPETLEAGLRAARSIDSDFELASWLVEVAAAAPLTERLRPAFFAAAASVESAHERGRLLKAALATEKPSTGLLEDILDAATGIDSDFEKAGLLTELASRGLVTEALRPAFRRAFETLGSRFERDRVLAALGRRAI